MKKFVLTLCLGLCTLSMAYAQEEHEKITMEAGAPLTLEKAIEIACTNNPTIWVGDMEIKRYDYVYNQAVSTLYPQIEASAQYALAVRRQEMTEGFSFGGKNTFNLAANVGVPLFAPSVYRQMKLTKTQMATAVESARANKIDLIASVRSAYFNVLLAQESLRVLDEAIATTGKVVNDTELLYNNELVSEYDMITAEVQKSTLEAQRIQAVNAVDITMLQLKMYLSLPEDMEITLAGTLDDYCLWLCNPSYIIPLESAGVNTNGLTEAEILALKNENINTLAAQRESMIDELGTFTNSIKYDVDKLVGDFHEAKSSSAHNRSFNLADKHATVEVFNTKNTLLANNTTLRTLDLNSELLEHQEKLIQTTRMPTIAAFASISYIGQERIDLSGLLGGGMGAGGGAAAPSAITRAAAASQSKFWWQYPINVGAQISIPIFSGLKKTNQIHEVRNQQNQLKFQREYAVEGIMLQLQQSVNTLVAARESLRANVKTVEQAQKAYFISETRYNAGAGTILELNSAQLTLIQAQLNYSQAVYDYLSAYTQYRAVLGVDEQVAGDNIN